MTIQHNAGTRFLQSRFLRVCLVLYVVAALGILFLGRGSFTIFILVFALILYIGVPLLLGSLVLWGMARYRCKNSWVCYAKRGLLFSLCLVALMLPLWGADRVAKYDVARAKAFCESLLPELNESHARTGAYPEDISTLNSYQKPPWLFRYSKIYHSDGEYFVFSIIDARTIMGGWGLSNSKQIWQYKD